MITLINKPYPIMAAFNGNYFEMQSDKSLEVGFKYLIRVTLLTYTTSPGPGPISSTVQLYEITPEANKNGFFDVSVMTSLILLEALPNKVFDGLDSFIRRAICSVQVEFAEYYNGDAYNYDVSYTYQAWDASKLTIQLYKKEPDYAYVWPGGLLPAQGVVGSQIQNLISEKVFEDSSSFYSVINYNGGSFAGIRIDCFTLDGSQFRTSYLDNPLVNTGLIKNSHLLIDVGMRALRSYTPTSGANPMIPNEGVDFYYELSFRWLENLVEEYQPIKTYYPTCKPIFDVYIVHYKSRLGAWETCVFDKSSSKALQRDAKAFGVYTQIAADQLTGSQYKNPIYARSTDRIMNINTSTIYQLNTGWLSEEEVQKYSELFDSPQIYLEISLDDSNVYFEMLAIPNTYVINKKYNKKKYSLNMSFRLAAKENRQR